MDRKKFLAERQWTRSQLANVADFWLKNGWDHEHGGVATCLDWTAQVCSTDKSVLFDRFSVATHSFVK